MAIDAWSKEHDGSGKLAEPIVHSCGKSFAYAQPYVKHAKGCDGTAPLTVSPRDRTAGRHPDHDRGPNYPFARPPHVDEPVERTPPAPKPAKRRRVVPRKKNAKRSAVPHKTERNRNTVNGRRQKAPRSSTADDKKASEVRVVSPADFIAACRVEIGKLERAIAAAEALA